MSYMDNEYKQLVRDQYPTTLAEAMILDAEFVYRELDYRVSEIVMTPQEYRKTVTDDKMDLFRSITFAPPSQELFGYKIIITRDIEGVRYLFKNIRMS